MAEEIDKLPQRHSRSVDLFQDIKNKQDEEQYERKLADEALRERFYERLRDFGQSLCRSRCHRPGSWSRRPTRRSRSTSRTWRSS